MTNFQYIPLRAHSEFSIVDGIIRIKDVVKEALTHRLPALGLSDFMNVFGLVKFYLACHEKGIKPIIGVDVRIANETHPDKPFRALLIAKNNQGYLRLCDLLTRAYTAPDKNANHPELKPEWLEGDNSGLLCLSGAHLGEIGVALLSNHVQVACETALRYKSLFNDGFYLELQRLPERPELENVVAGSLQLAQMLDIPVVATHPAQFLRPDDFEAHEVRVCIAGGWVMADKRRPRDFVPSQYFAQPSEMIERFADIPEALENTVEIAKRCNLSIRLGQNFLPVFDTPEGLSLNDYLVKLANEGLNERLAFLYPDETVREAKYRDYAERLKFELDIIIQMDFAGYFLIVADFINWAKNNGCPVGPGRGSGAGSLVAYSLKITDLDPLAYDLLFERFLNPERVSMPDFDIDFCQENRWRVIQYVREKYGAEAVCQIITFGTMSSKAVLRDVGRVLDFPYGMCDRLAKLIPEDKQRPVSLTDAMKMDPEISKFLEDEGAEELMVFAQKLEDMTRNVGMHAGGVLIAPGKIADFCPVYQAGAADAASVSMFDKGDVEKAGLVKFDFLGLRNLTVIELTQRYIKMVYDQEVDVSKLPLDDANVYHHIFATGNTTAVFQLESTGMKKMLRQARPSQFEEIIAFVSLYRPGPMDLIPDFIARMHGRSFEYLHPLLEPILKPTYGIMVYQEQVMQAGQICGGYTLGGADLLRRAMSKKNAAEMNHQRTLFVKGARDRGIEETKANEIFDYMEKFAEYGFNKSHAAAYALVSYQTAWLKHYYPAEFMAATMSSELDNTDQLKALWEDALAGSLEFLPPCVNESFYRFTPNRKKQIRYALGALKGIGENVADAIVKARESGGKFTDLFDFCERVGKEHINRRSLESLIQAGAFDAIEPNRAFLSANIDLAMSQAAQKAASAHQISLFDAMDDIIEPIKMQAAEPWSLLEEASAEKTAIGFYFSRHPFGVYRDEVRSFSPNPLNTLKAANHIQRIAGFVTHIRTTQNRRGKALIVTLEDDSGRVEVWVAGQLLLDQAKTLEADQVMVFEGKVSVDDYNTVDGVRMQAQKLYTLPAAREAFARQLHLKVTPNCDEAAFLQLLREALVADDNSRKVPLIIQYRNDQATATLQPATRLMVALKAPWLEKMQAILGEKAVHVVW